MKRTSGASIFNLRRHLALRHGVKIGNMKSVEKQKKDSIASQPTIDHHLRLEIDQLLLDCILQGGLPYNHFENRWFHQLFDKLQPGYLPPDRRTFAKRVNQKYFEYIMNLKLNLPRDRPFAYTADTWKCSTRHFFICLTGHTFNDDMQLVSLLLSFRRLTGRKLSKNLYRYLKYELNRFGLNECTSAGITTDGGSDITAATKSGEFGYRFHCVAHLLNLVVDKGVCIWKRPIRIR